jgi:hypothetical protein
MVGCALFVCVGLSVFAARGAGGGGGKGVSELGLHQPTWSLHALGQMPPTGLSNQGCTPFLYVMPYEPSLARAPVAHERAVRRGPDPV